VAFVHALSACFCSAVTWSNKDLGCTVWCQRQADIDRPAQTHWNGNGGIIAMSYSVLYVFCCFLLDDAVNNVVCAFYDVAPCW